MKGVDDLQTDIDQSLEYIESQQSELAQALDSYEGKVMELMEGSNADGSGRVVMNPVDEERERSYHLAETLNKQLDDMGKQLKYMIDDINHSKAAASGSSSGVGDGSPAAAADEDNPVETIVQILSQHLSSLQWLDSSTAELTHQIHDLERRALVAKEDAERVHKKEGAAVYANNRSSFGGGGASSILQQQQQRGMFGASVGGQRGIRGGEGKDKRRVLFKNIISSVQPLSSSHSHSPLSKISGIATDLDKLLKSQHFVFVYVQQMHQAEVDCLLPDPRSCLNFLWATCMHTLVKSIKENRRG